MRVSIEDLFLYLLYHSLLTYPVSDPAHHRYGQHLTDAEVNELVKPSDDALSLVHEWLADYGISSSTLRYSPAKDWIKISLPVSSVETLLDTKYNIYEHEEGGYIVRAPHFSLPQHLHDHIDLVQPTNSFFRAKAQRSSLKAVGVLDAAPAASLAGGSVDQVCNDTAVTPLCLRTLYGTVDYTPKAAGRNKVGLNDFLGESNNRSDVHLFLEKYRPEAVAAAKQFKVEVIAHGTDDQHQLNATELDAGTELEGNLDAETILGISWPTPLTAFTTGGNAPFKPDIVTPTDSNEPYLVWVQHVLDHPNPPQVISTSYDDDEQTVPLSYAKAVCNSFAQLGAKGVSLLFASGDGGVGGDARYVPDLYMSLPLYMSVYRHIRNRRTAAFYYAPPNLSIYPHLHTNTPPAAASPTTAPTTRPSCPSSPPHAPT
jgi:tripeptidyl-peptidase-1